MVSQWQGGRAEINQQLFEVSLSGGINLRLPALIHDTAIRHNSGELLCLPLQMGLQFGPEHRLADVIGDQMVGQSHHQPLIGLNIGRNQEPQEGCMTHVECQVAGNVKELLNQWPLDWVKLDLLPSNINLAAHHLQRLRQTLPKKCRPQNRMAVNQGLPSCTKSTQSVMASDPP